jgi:hypothetical protein
LLNLGWQPREADQAIAAVAADMLAANGGGAGDPDGEASPNGKASAKINGAADGAPAEVDVAAMLRAALRKLSRA